MLLACESTAVWTETSVGRRLVRFSSLCLDESQTLRGGDGASGSQRALPCQEPTRPDALLDKALLERLGRFDDGGHLVGPEDQAALLAHEGSKLVLPGTREAGEGGRGVSAHDERASEARAAPNLAVPRWLIFSTTWMRVSASIGTSSAWGSSRAMMARTTLLVILIATSGLSDEIPWSQSSRWSASSSRSSTGTALTSQ